MPENKPPAIPESATPLRQRAEELLRTSRTDISEMATEDIRVLVHELEVHQIELELQNEELREAQVELAESRDRYSDLYDFAPVGYLTLDPGGRILNANLTAATMLGVERRHLLQSNISNFVRREHQDECYLHRQSVFSSTSKHTCELEMHKADRTPIVVRLESIAFGTEDNRRCRTALIDVTSVWRARQQLEESQQRYRRLTEAVTDYIYRVRVEHDRAVETIHGPNCEAVTGYTPEEFAANHVLWIAMVPPEDRPTVEQQATRILSGQDVPPIEHRIRRKDGQMRWVLNTVSPQYDDQRRLIAYDGLLRDITERKDAEEALRQLNEELEQRVDARTADLRARTDQLASHSRELEQREQQLRLFGQAISNLGEGVLITNDHLDWPGPHIVFVNEAMCRISGYTAEELIGQSPRILQGNGTDRATLDRIKAELSGGSSVVAELTNYREDGTPYDAELFITPLFDSEGRRTHFVSIHRDVTERKGAERRLRESEDRLRAVLDTAADVIINIDQRGIITNVNRATEQMFGYTQDELIGQNVKILMPPPYHGEHDGYIARYLETGAGHIIGVGREVVARHKDGSTFPVGLAVSEVEHLGLFTGIIRDISERHKLQRDLLATAEHERRRIGQDLHDGTQQGLAGLGMLAQTLLDKLAAGSSRSRQTLAESQNAASPNSGQFGYDASEYCNLAKKIVDGITRTHREVQAVSRGLVPMRLAPGGLMDALGELAARTDELEGVTCAFKCEQPVEIADNLTATHLYRIAQEALTNALKHARPEHILIALESDNGRPVLQVADDGAGFDAAKQTDGMGLKTMCYRASLIGANLTINPVEAGGTLVTCKVIGGG